MRHQDLLASVLTEVGQCGAGVRDDTRCLVVESGEQGWHNLLMEALLEVTWEIIRKLTDAVERGVSDLRIGVLQMVEHDGHHWLDLCDIIDVLSDLGEGHDASVLVTPVFFVSNGVLDKLSNQREHVLVAHTSDKTVDGGLSEVDIIFFLILSLETFLGLEPVSIDVSINVNHELEDLLKDILG